MNLKNTLFFVLCSLFFLAACGGNNGQVGNPDAGTDGGDVKCAAVNCDDKIACTRDSCDEATGECRHQADHALCTGGTVCMPKEGCKSPPPCANDMDCPDMDDGPCMQEYCEPASSTCRWNPLDKDGDGHAPQICADIGGDDCNDDDNDLYPGAEEECDGRDEDCDGIIDNKACPCEILTCRQVMDCFQYCSGTVGECEWKASDQAQQQTESWWQCVEANCHSAGGECKQNCEDEAVICEMAAPDSLCYNLFWCEMDCAFNDQTCVENCYNASPDCYQCLSNADTQCLQQICPNEFDAYMNCVNQNCADVPEDQQGQCIEQNCEQQSTALGLCYGDGDLIICAPIRGACYGRS